MTQECEIEGFFRALELRDDHDSGEDVRDPFEDAKGVADTTDFLVWCWSTEPRLRGRWLRWEPIYNAYLEFCWFGGYRPVSSRCLQIEFGRRQDVLRRRPFTRVGQRRPTMYCLKCPPVSLEQTWEMAA